MNSARRLSWLALAFGALAVGALLGTALAVAAHVSFGLPAAADLLAACGRLLPAAGVGGVAMLAALAVAGMVVLRAGRAVLRQLRGHRRLRRALRVLAVQEFGGVRFRRIAGETPRAFCAGWLRPSVYVSDGALSVLGPPQLAAVLAHEEHHRRCRDPLRLAAGAVLAEAFFFVPALRRLHERYAAIAELAADEAAVRRGDAAALASAMLRFTPSAPNSPAVGISPERVDHLLGQSPRWDIPALLVGGSLAALALFVIAGLGGAAAAGTVNVPMALMGSCALLMAAPAIGAIAGAVPVVRRRRR